MLEGTGAGAGARKSNLKKWLLGTEAWSFFIGSWSQELGAGEKKGLDLLHW